MLEHNPIAGALCPICGQELPDHDPACDRRPMPVTALDVAKARGAREIDGRIEAGEFERVGIPLLGGCERCHATIAAYNAYPSTTGYWRCGDCIADLGFATVEEFESFEPARSMSWDEEDEDEPA